jgi:hypothetical protein
LWSLSDAAYRLHCSATILSNRTLTDGYIPADRVRVLVPRFRPAALRELLDTGRWTTADGGYTLADFGTDQRSRESVLAERAAWKLRQAANRHPVTPAVTPAVSHAAPVVSPVVLPAIAPLRVAIGARPSKEDDELRREIDDAAAFNLARRAGQLPTPADPRPLAAILADLPTITTGATL